MPELQSQIAHRFPQDQQLAYNWLVTGFDGNLPGAAGGPAIDSGTEPDGPRTDMWYRMIVTADRANKGTDIVARTAAWVNKAQAKYGPEPGYGDTIGETMYKHGLKDEGVAYWKMTIASDPTSSYGPSAAMKLADTLPPAERTKFLEEQLARKTNFHGMFASVLANDALKANDIAAFEKILTANRQTQNERPLRPWNFDSNTASSWVDTWRANRQTKPEDKLRVFNAVKNLDFSRASAIAKLAILELEPQDKVKPLERLLAYQSATVLPAPDSGTTAWDRMLPYAQAAMVRKDYEAAASLLTGMLANIRRRRLRRVSRPVAIWSLRAMLAWAASA